MKPFRFSLLCFLLIGGCIPDDLHDFDFRENQPPLPDQPGMITFELIGEKSDRTVSIRLSADGGWNAGYRPLRVVVAKAGAAVADAQVTVTGIGRFADGERSLPINRPFTADPDSVGLYGGSLFLLGDRADLRILAEIQGESYEVVFEDDLPDHPLAVRNIGSDGLAVHAVWMHPRNAVVGRNSFETVLFYETSTGFEPLGGAAVDIYPYMDMGGGDGHSTPFTTPEEHEVGRWHSEITFVMSGGWELSLYLERTGAERDTFLFSPFIVFEP